MTPESKPPFAPQPSVDWYNPAQLAKTGIKTLLSGIFGTYLDKREVQAALKREGDITYYDYSDRTSISIDYAADLGDGFDATYSIATMLAQETLECDGQKTKRGEVLIMGGDQVYPTASREEYANRLQGPYEAAFPKNPEDNDRPALFAIPGNHDWYDGLSNFLKVFCQQRTIGNWQTRQHRSYFALKLPHNVWLFGIDVQLNSDIDINQLEYFEDLLENHIAIGSSIILCTAEPSWVYSTSDKKNIYNNLRFFEERYANYTCKKTGNKKTRQVLTLAGDLHHYSRYETEEGTQKITAGGGGAFLHPTHNLPETICGLREPGVAGLKARFPHKAKSKKLLWKNFLFGFISWRFSLFTSFYYGLCSWLMVLTFSSSPKVGLDNLAVSDTVSGILLNPALSVLILIFGFGIFSFTDTKPYNKRYRFYSLAGGIHALLQVFAMIGTFSLYSSVNPFKTVESMLLILWNFNLLMVIAGFFLAPALFGIYLMMSNALLGNHDNEAFSALRINGFKNFLRIELSQEKIMVYPFGMEKTPGWRFKNGRFIPHGKLEVKLIEDPVVINLQSEKINILS